MKEEISSIELSYLVQELQEIVGGRIDKIYQKEKNFLITMHVPRKGRKMLKITLPGKIYLTEHKETFPDTPSGFSIFLRRHLSNTKIISITQKNFERILEIEFEGKEENKKIILELFGNGNLVVCNEEGKIISAFDSVKMKDRTVRGGIKYEYPPTQTNTPIITEKEFKDIIKNSKMDSIVKILAVDFSLGGLYAEELCLLTKIDKGKKTLSATEQKILYEALKKLFSKKISANTCEEEVLPFKLKQFKNIESYETYSEALDDKFSEKIISNYTTEAENKKQSEIDTQKQIIKQQEEAIKGLKISAEENQRKGEIIYEHYDEVKEMLASLNIARKKYSWEEIKTRLKNHKKVKQVNDKQGTIIVEL